MARGDNATVDVEAGTENGTGSSEPDLMKLQADFGFRGPVALRFAVEEAAASAKLLVAAWLKKVVADHVGFALPAEAATSRGLSDEEKKDREEAAKAKAKAERKATQELLKQNREAKGLTTTSTSGTPGVPDEGVASTSGEPGAQ